MGKPRVLNALWYSWFGIASLRHLGCWGSGGGSYDGSDEHWVTRKVVSVCIVATLLPYAALLLPVHQFWRPGNPPFSRAAATMATLLFHASACLSTMRGVAGKVKNLTEMLVEVL